MRTRNSRATFERGARVRRASSKCKYGVRMRSIITTRTLPARSSGDDTRRQFHTATRHERKIERWRHPQFNSGRTKLGSIVDTCQIPISFNNSSSSATILCQQPAIGATTAGNMATLRQIVRSKQMSTTPDVACAESVIPRKPNDAAPAFPTSGR